jgi:prepilin-type N-terminal cleavage/methylation domain-containing protein
MNSPTRAGGFTLIEMLTVVAIFGVVAMYVGRILIVNERAYHTVENTSESQQNLRVFGELIEDDLRHAGMMVSSDSAVCGVDSTTAPDLLYVSDAAAIDPQDDFDPYDGAVIAGGPYNLNTNGTAQTFTLSSLVIEPSPPNRPAYDTDNNGTLDSDFRIGAGVIVSDPADPARGNACGRITAINLATPSITVVGVAAMGSAGSGLVAVPANEYRLNGTQLLWNNVALANGIEDFQVAYVRDEDGDNVIDGNTDRRSFGGAGTTNYSSSEFPAQQMREVEIGLVSRSRQTDAAFRGRPQALLNRTPVTTADGFRRRTFQTRVLLRNLATRIAS